MKRIIIPLLCLLLPLAARADPAPQATAVLHWKNGETVAGEIAAASATELTWKSPLFEDPLQLQWNVIDRIDSQQEAARVAWWALGVLDKNKLNDPFGIDLRDGSFIYGDLVAIIADSISIHSIRHGDVALKRSEVLSMRRLKHGNLLLSFPTGEVGWKIVVNADDGGQQSGPVAAPLATGPGGALLMQAWNCAAQLDLTTPNLADVEFRVRSSKRPEFLFAFGKNAGAPRIETWDDELVLTDGDHFKFFRKIADSEREVALRICWDAKTRKYSVFTAAGEPVAEWQTPAEDPEPGQGFFLQNKGLDLSLEFLRVREWDGKPPAQTDVKQPRIELDDGRSLAGEVVSGSGQNIQFHAAGRETAAEFPLGDIDALVFSTDAPKVAPHQAVLSYADGTLLFGSIASIAGGRAFVGTSFTADPLPSGLEALRRLLIRVPAPAGAAPETPFAQQDCLVIQQTTLHGHFQSGGDGWPRWLPVGGVAPATPSKSHPGEITRVLPTDAKHPVYPALFYLASGDVLPGTLSSLDRSGAEFSSDLMEARKIPAAELDAIQFSPPTGTNLRGFGADAGWRILKGDEKSVRITKDSIEMDAGTAIIQPSIMECDEIKFNYPGNGNYSSVRLRLFCSGTDASHSTNILLGNMGPQFYAGFESSQGQMINGNPTNIRQGQEIAVRLVNGEKQIDLYVNDILSAEIPIDPSKRTGAGLILEPAGLWGNPINNVALSQFSATSTPGRTWLPDINKDVRMQTLTVPRFRRDDPPRHALLASNGDILRGEIEAATSAHFGFRCGLEELDVPRDRVKAVIWLKQPLEGSAGPAASPGPDPLERVIDRRMGFGRAELPVLIDFLQQEAGDLKFKLSGQQDHRQVQMQFGGQTVGDALRQICSLFHMRYRMEGGNTVVLEDDQPAEPNLVSKLYWLKADAMPKTADARQILAAKGITFPSGASAQWQANACLLSMTNTPENQDKLAALLNSDFGGPVGSPTHWLLLTSGARFALIVDKFDQEFVTGHHPVYGNCKVPMSEVYAITASMPEPTGAIKSLQDWRLVYAPEPVLPDAGGENSPVLGKAAFVFKLPLLKGGDFDLAAEKGHVVVLDFWATWCGPCVKSLPGVIEAMSSFPSDRVKLIGVNQGEPSAQVKQFLETRGWKLTVAMDGDQSVARKYGVDAIPQTVIIGPDGTVAWVKVGYSADGEKEASDVVKRLLDKPSNPLPAQAPAGASTQ